MSDSLKAEMLASRIEQIEQSVFGKEVPVDLKDQPTCVDQLFTFHSRFSNAISKREKITRVLNRVNEIEKYMDPTFFDDISLSNEAKARVILAEEENIREMAKAMEKLQALSEVLNSEHLKGIPQLRQKFASLSQNCAEQEKTSVVFNAQVEELLESYNYSIDLLSKLFVQWDQKVTETEDKRKK